MILFLTAEKGWLFFRRSAEVKLTSDLTSEIRKLSLPGRFGDGQDYLSLPVKTVQVIAETFQTSLRRVETAALSVDIVPERYARNMRTLSPAQQKLLLDSRVAIVGLGGLGGSVCEILSRIGIGTLTLIDGDAFEDSNLNRQRFSSQDVIAHPKAEIARQKIGRINPSISLYVYPEFLNENNGNKLLKDSNVVVDCLDSLKNRFVLQRVARALGIPLVSGAIAGLSGHLTVIFPDDIGLSLIYGPEENLPAKGAEASLGTLAPCVNTIAALETSEVIKIILKQSCGLRNHLLAVDLQDNSFDVMRLLD